MATTHARPENRPTTNRLAAFLRDRRARLDPVALGLPATRRRTPGLRREEVAARAHISATWYTWLEQGRGGAPSADVLDRISRALMLTGAEREHLFLLGLGHPPEARYKVDTGVTPQLQRVLDALDPCPALIRTATWDVIAWNRAAAVLLTDYAMVPPDQRNILRLIFADPGSRARQPNWHSLARYVLAAFRYDIARAGAEAAVAPLIEDLRHLNPDFDALWQENEVCAPTDGVKHMIHPRFGSIALDYSNFSVDARPDLGMVIYNPVDPAVTEAIAKAIA